MVQIRMQRLAAQYQVNFMFTPMPLADHEHLRNRAKFSWEQALVAGGLTATSPLHRMLPPIDRTTDEQGHQPKALPLYLQSAELYMKLLKAYPKARLARMRDVCAVRDVVAATCRACPSGRRCSSTSFRSVGIICYWPKASFRFGNLSFDIVLRFCLARKCSKRRRRSLALHRRPRLGRLGLTPSCSLYVYV